MSHKPDTTHCWMGNEYHVNGKVAGTIAQEDGAWTWSVKRYNNTRGLCHTRERAQWWVEHYANRMGA